MGLKVVADERPDRGHGVGDAEEDRVRDEQIPRRLHSGQSDAFAQRCPALHVGTAVGGVHVRDPGVDPEVGLTVGRPVVVHVRASLVDGGVRVADAPACG